VRVADGCPEFDFTSDPSDIPINVMFPLPSAKIGVPQGAPVSPLLAILILDDTLIKENTTDNSRVVGYSDD